MEGGQLNGVDKDEEGCEEYLGSMCGCTRVKMSIYNRTPGQQRR